jgi:hypothetical protein
MTRLIDLRRSESGDWFCSDVPLPFSGRLARLKYEAAGLGRGPKLGIVKTGSAMDRKNNIVATRCGV